MTAYSPMAVIRVVSLLHPKMKAIATDMHADLTSRYKSGAMEFQFDIFETFRFPDRQAMLLRERKTKAGPWQSAHQVGLAVDFVPYLTASQAAKVRPGGSNLPGWYWPAAEHKDWRALHTLATEYGLNKRLNWDSPHCEHPLFDKMQKMGF